MRARTSTPDDAKRVTMQVSTVGIVYNAALTVFKLVAGIVAHSSAIVADAVHLSLIHIFRLHGLEHHGQADNTGVHRHDRRLPQPAAEAGECALNAQLENKRMQKAPGHNVRGLSVWI